MSFTGGSSWCKTWLVLYERCQQVLIPYFQQENVHFQKSLVRSRIRLSSKSVTNRMFAVCVCREIDRAASLTIIPGRCSSSNRDAEHEARTPGHQWLWLCHHWWLWICENSFLHKLKHASLIWTYWLCYWRMAATVTTWYSLARSVLSVPFSSDRQRLSYDVCLTAVVLGRQIPSSEQRNSQYGRR